MELPRESALLRIYVAEDDKYHGKPLYRAIVGFARAHGLAGATVLRGMLGFGKSSNITSTRILRFTENLPIVIEIVDTRERIDAILPELDAMISKGALVTLEKIEVVAYRPGKEKEPPPNDKG